jgi:hypothetical protein
MFIHSNACPHVLSRGSCTVSTTPPYWRDQEWFGALAAHNATGLSCRLVLDWLIIGCDVCGVHVIHLPCELELAGG